MSEEEILLPYLTINTILSDAERVNPGDEQAWNSEH